MNSTNQIKFGAILSYILLALNTIYSLFITPFILRYVGVDTYGVFKSVSSLSSTLAVIDFGLGTTMTRYIAKYNAEDKSEEENNFIAMIFIEFSVIVLALIIVGTIFGFNVGNIYASTFDAKQMALAKSLFSILIINMGLRLTENLFFGIVNGKEKFVFANGLKVTSLLLKIAIIALIFPLIKNIYVVALSETIIALSCVTVFAIYCIKKLKIRPKLVSWDVGLFKESFLYTSLMFIQNLVMQFSGNVDNILIGATISASAVTVYSMALTIYNMYQNLSGSVANLMLPRITRKIANGANYIELQNEVEKFGRYQFFILAGALGGVVCLGKEFFYLWLGDGYGDCFPLSLILITCVTLPTIGNVALSIMRAENKMVYRTVTLIISCTANIIVTIVGIHLWGYWGAAIGTGLAAIINFVCMNSYYHTKYGFRILKMLSNITLKTIICALIPTVLVFFVKQQSCRSWTVFLAYVFLFLSVYFPLLYFISMNKDEKIMIKKTIHVFNRKRE